jgi:very-short-patch-repair endonuclease
MMMVKTYSYALIPRARHMRREMTPAEKHLWLHCLRYLPCKFRKQRPFGHFIVDFYCAELKWVIEVDGNSHFNEAALAYDAERTLFLEGLGLRVLRFTNSQVFQELENIKQFLFQETCLAEKAE